MEKKVRKIPKNFIKQASKEKFPDRGYKEEFYMDEAKELEQPAFVKGAKWAVKEFDLEPSDFIKQQVKLLKWLQDEIGSDYSISPHETYEKLVERFNKQKQ